MKEYVIESKIKNNLLLSRILEFNVSVNDFCKENNLRACEIGAYINMKKSPLTLDGNWTKTVWTLSMVLGTEPENLFSEEQRKAIKTNVVRFELDTEQCLQMLECPSKQLNYQQSVQRLLTCLTEREKKIVALRQTDSLMQIGESLNLSGARVRQIEMKAYRKMRMNAKRFGLITERSDEHGNVTRENNMFD